MRRNGKAITIQSVAEAAGVSVSTVSRVLNKKDDVSQETVEKVQSVIENLGYVSSLAARGLRSHRTNVIGLVIPDVGTPYCFEILRGVNHVIAQKHFDLMIYTDCDSSRVSAAAHERSFVSLLNGGITDGVIVVTPTATTFPDIGPLTVVDPNHEAPDLPGVISTNYEGALDAMRYLIGLGHRRIAHIAGRLELVSAFQRVQAYRDALAEAGIEFDERYLETGDYTESKGEERARKLLSLNPRPTAIFAANDQTAFGVYRAAKEAGVCIPDELSVLGFDNLREAPMVDPALTTVDQSLEEMGAMAAEMIVKLVSGEPLQEMLPKIKTRLIVRASCAPPAP